MTRIFDQHCTGRIALCCATALLLALCVVSSSVEAGIMLPAGVSAELTQLNGGLDLERASGASGASSSSTSHSDSNEAPPGIPERVPSEPEWVHLLAAPSPSNGGSTSGSSSSAGGSSSGSPTLLSSVSAASLPDLALSGWIHGEQSFSLPSPPGNDLLRPPQV